MIVYEQLYQDFLNANQQKNQSKKLRGNCTIFRLNCSFYALSSMIHQISRSRVDLDPKKAVSSV